MESNVVITMGEEQLMGIEAKLRELDVAINRIYTDKLGELKPINPELAAKVTAVLDEKSQRVFPKDNSDNILMGYFSGDDNDFHFKRHIAEAYGARGIPIMGTFLALTGEQVVSPLLNIIREHWGLPLLKVIGQKTRFAKEVIPGDRLIWGLRNCRENKGSLEIELGATLPEQKEIYPEFFDKDSSGNPIPKDILSVSARIGSSYPEPIVIEGKNPLRDPATYVIGRQDVRALNRQLGVKDSYFPVEQKPEDKPQESDEKKDGEEERKVEPILIVPYSLPSAFAINEALRYVESQFQRKFGMNVAMNVTVLGEVGPCKAKVSLYEPDKVKSRGAGYFYSMRGICKKLLPDQTAVHSSYVELSCFSEHQLKF